MTLNSYKRNWESWVFPGCTGDRPSNWNRGIYQSLHDIKTEYRATGCHRHLTGTLPRWLIEASSWQEQCKQISLGSSGCPNQNCPVPLPQGREDAHEYQTFEHHAWCRAQRGAYRYQWYRRRNTCMTSAGNPRRDIASLSAIRGTPRKWHLGLWEASIRDSITFKG